VVISGHQRSSVVISGHQARAEEEEVILYVSHLECMLSAHVITQREARSHAGRARARAQVRKGERAVGGHAGRRLQEPEHDLMREAISMQSETIKGQSMA
jgi:hypothetical protein